MDMQKQLERLTRRADVGAAVAFVRAEDETTLATQIAISEIPAPPFEEAARGQRVADLLEACGLGPVRRDDEGNVIAERPGATVAAPLVVSAHLDTVFPAGTEVRVTRDRDRLRGPGISDDARGLATLVTLARMFEVSSIETRRPLLFVATVGEEGAGNLRGVKHLFSPAGAAHGAAGFISLDGAGLERIVVEGLGSRRYRVTATGAGGHSWVDWGAPNPIHALTSLGHRLQAIDLPTEPRTTLTIARIGGGTSINAIPQSAWLELDTRGGPIELDSMEAAVRGAVDEAGREHDGLSFRTTVIGDRPGGRTSIDAPLVRAASAATLSLERTPVLALSSTDSNVPMAAGVPAVTLGCGGRAGQAHTTDEWYRNVGGVDGIIRAFHTVLLAAGVADEGPTRPG